MEIAALLLDILLIALLAATVFFVLRLHNRLEVMRGGKGDLESLLRDLITTTQNAERSLNGLRISAGDLSDTLGKQVRGAENAREELEYLLASADNKAKQLMNAVESAKVPTAQPMAQQAPAPVQQQAAAPAAPTPANTATPPAADKRQQAESDLLKAIEKLR